MTIEQVQEAEYQVCKEITFISEEQIDRKFWSEACELVRGIDSNDVQYVAYSKQFRCKIWSGDKKLFNGLRAKGFTNILNTDELFELRNDKLKL